MSDAARRIFCALDTTDRAGAAKLAARLAGTVGGVKLGLEFFGAHGPAGVAAVKESALPLFLDLKFHDIPNTVAGAVRAVLPLAPALLTVHASGGRAMLEAARDAAAHAGASRPKIVAVTVLTSLDDGDLDAVGQRGPALDQVKRLAEIAQRAGIDGVVCSPREVAALRAQCGPGFLLVVPGIRPAWATAGDQKRVMTPAEAVAAGADHLVIGRPITGAPDPAEAARRIAAELTA
ncbi:MAG TPA: orotidine-5'-phosphate decarboxylase [Kofleriaceae bacterium]|nr:orotidine-5'-phosphate decarboxylase [Kofleriaceae bacterium]